METFEGNDTSALKPQAKEPLLRFASSSSLTHITHSTLDSDGFTDEALSQKFEDLELRSNEDEDINGNQSDNGSRNGGRLYPLRPYAEDCPYYLRTGMCKFRLSCKFNHPVRRANQKVGKEKEKHNEKDKAMAKEGLSEKSEQIECKYYLSTGGCKYGKSCRYNHSKDESEIAPSELNFLGLPIRLGEKECPFYMRNGSCGYGARCRFHHPDPTAVGGHDPHNPTPNDESVGKFGLPSGYYYGESVPLHVSGASQPAQASWSSQRLSDNAVPYESKPSSGMPVKHFLPQGPLQTPEWHGYQAPNFPDERTRHPHSAPAAKSLTQKLDFSSQFEEFPERTGQPECIYFMKTGYCKFKSACRYHHPKNQAPKADCVLSDKGLPLRPGRKICRHYEQFGICKHGRACLFDHPVNHSSTFPVGSVLESP